MNNKETKYKDIEVSFSKKILNVIIYVIIPIVLLLGLIYVNKNKTGGFLKFILFYSFLFIIAIGAGKLSAVEEAKKVINKENKIIKKNNPYIYYRELPNDYGIGVISLLVDSKLENYKDIIAVILDLCAKKYLFLEKRDNKYYIKVLKNVDDKLLSNERYILDLIVSNNLRNINYKEWYNFCLQDGINLGIYYHVDREQIEFDNEVKSKPTKLWTKYVKVGSFIGFVFIIFLILFNLQYTETSLNILFSVFVIFLYFVFFFFFSIYAVFLAKIFNKILEKNDYKRRMIYNMTLNNHLNRTEKGVIELQKLLSFKQFLLDFGNMVSKSPLEVILWDRYLSYAQVFGLTKDIMKTGYKQLIENSSFQIDDIDNITINNIEIDNRL